MKKSQATLAALALAFAALSHAAGPTGLPNSLNVKVTNTPLPVQGTVSGSVSISNQPNVFVTNTAANPVPTRDLSKVTAPLQLSGFDGWVGSLGLGSPTVVFGPVQEGKRWEIEYLSLGAFVDTGAKYRCEVDIVTTTIVMKHDLLVRETPEQVGIRLVASTPIKLYAESGQLVWVRCQVFEQNNDGGSRQLDAAITGTEVSVVE